jgi:hypothetical protein
LRSHPLKQLQLIAIVRGLNLMISFVDFVVAQFRE